MPNYPITVEDAESRINLAMHSQFAGEMLLEAIDNETKRRSDDNVIGLLMSYNMAAASLQRALTEALTRNKARNAHAIKCLQRKGLYSVKFEDLHAICQRKNLLQDACKLQLMHCAMGSVEIIEIDNRDISDDAWAAGIEMTMLEYEPAHFYGTDLYGPVLIPHLGSIYVNTVLFNYGKRIAKYVELHQKRLDRLNAVAEQYGGFEEAFETFYSVLCQAEATADRQLDITRATFEQDRTRWKALEKELRNTISTLRKDQKPQTDQIKSLSARIDELETKLQTLSAENGKLTAVISERDRIISDLSQEIDTNLPNLPDTNVVFIGGHTNMVKKLTQKYPSWKFIDGTNPNFSAFAPPVCVFYWDRHMSHPTWQKAKSIIPASVPAIYLKATNPDKLEQEMRRGYASHIHQENSNEA